MSQDLNHVVMIGRLTKDTVLTYSSSQLPIGKFSIACNGWKEGDVSFFNCVAFGKPAEALTQYMLKGKQIAIHGRLKQNKWESDGKMNYSVEIIVNDIQLLASPSGGNTAKPENFEATDGSDFKEDIPF